MERPQDDARKSRSRHRQLPSVDNALLRQGTPCPSADDLRPLQLSVRKGGERNARTLVLEYVFAVFRLTGESVTPRSKERIVERSYLDEAPRIPADAQDAHGVVAFGETAQGEDVAYGFSWNFDGGQAATPTG